MTGRRRGRHVLVSVGLVAAAVGIGGQPPAGALTVPVVCQGDDSVLEGALSSENAQLDGILQGLPWATAPDRSQGVMALADIGAIDAGVAARTEPASVVPGPGDITFLVGIELGGATAPSLPTDELRVSDILFELTPASGVTGTPLVGTPPDVVVPLPATGSDGQEFTAPFDITAPVGGEATWNLTRAEIGASFTIAAGTVIDVEGTPVALPAAVDVQLGLSCEAQDNPIVRAVVLPEPQLDGPVVPNLEVSTPEGVPVDIDLLAGIEDGPAAPTDPDSIEILADPARGTVTDPVDGVVTYAPDADYVGEDTFAYLACTEPYLPGPTTTTSAPDTLTRGEQVEQTACNAGVVTITMEAAAVEASTTSTTSTTTYESCGCDVAEPQPEPPTFTG